MRRFIAVTTIAFLTITCAVQAEVKLPSVFSDHMVLQRDKTVNVWGWADPGENVTVSFAGQKVSATSDADGNWSVSLAPMKANSEPGIMTVKGANTITVKDVLVGEVWVCSGQSNMEFGLRGSTGCRDAAADIPTIRHFKVPHMTAVVPRDNVNASWTVATKASALGFTAVGYYFALEINKELNVPVGLLNNSWGGSRIEPYVSLEGMKVQQGVAANVSNEITNLDNLVNKAGEIDKQYIASVKDWVAEAEAAVEAGKGLPGMPTNPVKKPNAQTLAMKFNAMVNPLIPYTIRGALWYQGESNMGNNDYSAKMQALINDWRKRWHQGDFPFYYVQLAPYRGYTGERLGRFWEQQQKVLGMVKNTGMAVITDIGTLRNIHPPNKKDVGHRLAVWALHNDYGKADLEYSGPVYKDMTVESGKAILNFTHADGLKVNGGGELKCFEIAGADKKFHPAKTEIVNNTVVVSSPDVAEPVAVRMGWEKNAEPKLANSAGLVASPFRTDDW